jgi:hypothetical protein
MFPDVDGHIFPYDEAKVELYDDGGKGQMTGIRKADLEVDGNRILTSCGLK